MIPRRTRKSALPEKQIKKLGMAVSPRTMSETEEVTTRLVNMYLDLEARQMPLGGS